jgi:hypothetical protein
MKKIITILASAFLLFCANTLFAQRVVPVPTLTQDALFNAIASAAAGDILELADGGIYPNAATLATTVPLTIRTVPGYLKKAKVVYAANTSGTYPGNMFSLGASITIQNVIFDMKQGTKAAYGGVFLSRASTGIPGGVIKIDGVEAYKPGGFSSGGTFDSLIVRNCFLSGHIKNAGGWGVPFSIGKSELKYVEFTNNTFTFDIFACVLTDGWGNYNLTGTGKIVIDHNTFYNIGGDHGPSLMLNRTNDLVLTNNLWINPNFRPLEFFSDKYLDFPQNEDSLTAEGAKTIKLRGPKGLWIFSYEMGDSAKSNLLMEANNINWDPAILKIWSDRGLKPLYMWNYETSRFLKNASGVKDSTRAVFSENIAFTKAQAIPITQITSIADTVVKYSKDVVKYAKTTPYSGVLYYDLTTLAPLYDFKVKDSVNYAYPATAKSYTAGVYTSAMQALGVKGAAGYPLGDLNWFPTLKANWEKGIALTSVQQQDGVPVSFDLAQNYPNPFNPTTNINFSIQQSGLVTLKVFNILGQEVATLVNQNMQPGNYSVDFNASELSSGVFVYQITAGTFTSTKKMMLLK